MSQKQHRAMGRVEARQKPACLGEPSGASDPFAPPARPRKPPAASRPSRARMRSRPEKSMPSGASASPAVMSSMTLPAAMMSATAR